MLPAFWDFATALANEYCIFTKYTNNTHIEFVLFIGQGLDLTIITCWKIVIWLLSSLYRMRFNFWNSLFHLIRRTGYQCKDRSIWVALHLLCVLESRRIYHSALNTCFVNCFWSVTPFHTFSTTTLFNRTLRVNLQTLSVSLLTKKQLAT